MRAPVILVLLVLPSILFAAETAISHPEVIPARTDVAVRGAPAVVAGDGFLVLWSETYNYFFATPQVRTYDAGGAPRQPVPLTLPGGHTPHAFWNGSEYVIVHGLPMPKFGSSIELPAIAARRVRPDGTAVEGAVITLARSRASAYVHALAWDGTNALASVSHSGGYHLLLLDRTGAVVQDTPVDYPSTAIAAKPGGGFLVLRPEQGGAVAAGGGRFAAIQNISPQFGAVDVLILDAAGAELERFNLAPATSGSSSIVWDGSAWIAAYGDRRSLCTVRFTSGADLARTCEARPGAVAPSIAHGARGLFRAWSENGQVMTDAGLASTALSSVFTSDAVVDERGLLAAWVETTNASTIGPPSARLRVGGIANDGTPRPEYDIATVAPFAHLRLSRAGDRTLLVWGDRAAILDPAGGPPLFEVSLPRAGTAAIAARGDAWVLVGYGRRGVESMHLTRDLQVTAVEDFSGTAVQFEAAVAATPAGYLVVWREAEFGVGKVVVEPLDANGRRFAGGNRIHETDGPLAYPAVGCNAAQCLVTWYGETGELWYTFVTHGGTRIGGARMIPVDAITHDLAIAPAEDGSFLIYRSGTVTRVLANGEAWPTLVWHAQRITLGNVVTWRGRPTAVYIRPTFGQLFAFEFVPRARSVRH